MRAAACLCACMLITACGGGGGSGGSSQIRRPPSPPPPNSAPQADAGVDQQVVESTSVALDGSGSRDADGAIVTFAWFQISGPAVVLDGADAAAASFVAPAVDEGTTLFFELAVTDAPGAQDSDVVQVTVVPETFAVSGTITAARGIDVDGDVNDPGAPLVRNDTPAEAQPIANPITVGGYVTQPLAGAEGALQQQGDLSDFYRVELAAGQSIALHVAASDPSNDPDLYLWNSAGTQTLDESINPGGVRELLTVAQAGEALIEVFAFSGASGYTLIIGQAQIAGSSGDLVLSADFVPGEIIVERRPVAKASATARADAFRALGLRTASDAVGRPVLARLDGGGARAGSAQPAVATARTAALASEEMRLKHRTLLAIKALRRDPSVVYADLNLRVRPQAVMNDPLYPLQWHYPMIDLPAAWDLTFGEAAVNVAVIDTGVLPDHPDLAGQLEPGYDFISDPFRSADGDGIDPDPLDAGDGGGVGASSFHGTHVAGTVAAASDNGIGVAGVAPGVRLVPVRVLGVGGGSSYDIIQGIRWAAGLSNDAGVVRLPVDVMNLSLGRVGACTQAEQSAFDEARAQNVVVVVAAGNESLDASHTFPATCHGVLAVGAVDLLGNRAYYSNFGDLVDVQAPGGDRTVDQNGDGHGDGVLSTQGDPGATPPAHVYAFSQGTSMAAPHVAGVIALMKSVNVTLVPDVVDQLLADGAMTDELGVINAHASVFAALDALGTPPELDPMLSVSPASLNFGSAFTHATLDVRVTGGGTLIAGAPATSESWLHVVPVSLTTGNLGRYSVTVDRGAVAEGTHTAIISVTSDRNSVEVPVIMQVAGTALDADAGHLYVLLIIGGTDDVVNFVELDAAGGAYTYEFPNVAPGEYELVAGTDLDNDGFICDSGERCGVYPTLDQRGVPFVVDGEHSGADFSVGDVIPLTNAAEASAPALRAGPDGKTRR